MATPGAVPTGDNTTRDPRAAQFCEPIESATLSAILNDPKHELLKAMGWGLAPDDFGRGVYQVIYEAMVIAGPSYASVEQHLRQRGRYDEVADELLSVFNDPAGVGGIHDDWIETIKECKLRRTLWHKAQQLLTLSLRADLPTAIDTLTFAAQLRKAAEVSTGSDAQAADVQSLAELADDYWEAVAERKNSAPTGLAKLDEKIGGGLQQERLYVLLGGTGSGKTTLSNQVAEHIANAGRACFYVTSEDSPAALLAKTMARLGQVDYNAALYGHASARSALDDALALVMGRRSSGLLVYLHDTGSLSLEQMQEQARHHFEKYAEGGPGVLVIDYLQRMARMQPAGKAQDTRELVTLFTMRLRAVAEELGCSVLALSSINRASYGSKTDWLAASKESGDVEYTADCLLGLTEDEKGQAAPGHKAYTLTLAKNRLGPAGENIKLDWLGSRQQFTGA